MRLKEPDVSRLLKRINIGTYEVKKQKNLFKRDIRDIDSWWAGQSAAALKIEQQAIDKELAKILCELEQLQGDLRRLAKLT